MPYLMRSRNESAVYFDLPVDVTETRAFVERFNRAHPSTPITLFHVVLWGVTRTLAARPRLNRFVAGGQLWERKGIGLSYSAKKRKDDDSPLVVLKRRFDPDEPFERMVAGYYAQLAEGRSSKRSHVDKELGVVLRLGGMPLRALMAAGRVADSFGLLPASYIENDPMFASVFIANLASLKMDAGYHHLYEYGNIPVFCVIGQIKDTPVAEGTAVRSRPVANLRFSYDERVEDGLYAQRSLELLRQMLQDPIAAGIGIGGGEARSEAPAR
jgi:hypothetical protein